MQQEQKLYGVTALFNTSDDIMAAAVKVRNKGFKKWDVNTPYPVHGMDDAMGLSPSKLGWVTIALACWGASFAMFFMWMIMENVYPLNIGGKPFFSLPAFVPITFALAVLHAVLGTVFAMLAIFCKLPFNSHPLHDTAYMSAVISDKFGIEIEAANDGFDLQSVKSFLESIGGECIEEHYFPVAAPAYLPLPAGRRIYWNEGWFALVLVLVALGVCAKFYTIYNQVLYDRVPIIHVEDPITGLSIEKITGTKVPIAPFTWLDKQDKAKYGVKSRFFDDGQSMRESVSGTIPRGMMPYQFQGKPALAEKHLRNPLPMTSQVMERGREVYNANCSVCHGYFGDGDSRTKMWSAKGKDREKSYFNPPSLHTGKLVKAGDGLIYHIITEGQNIMPSYAKQIVREDRWKVVHYIRALQRAKNAKDSDLK
jgi:mono/diheme cytochrome c family protein